MALSWSTPLSTRMSTYVNWRESQGLATPVKDALERWGSNYQNFVDTRQEAGKATPLANYIAYRQDQGLATPMADITGYTPTKSQTTTRQQKTDACIQAGYDGYDWTTGKCLKNSVPGEVIPDTGEGRGNLTNDPNWNPSGEQLAKTDMYQELADTYNNRVALPGAMPDVSNLGQVIPGGVQDQLQVGQFDVPADTAKLPYINQGMYSDAFQNMLRSPAFGGQTLEELENARVQALQQDLSNQYGLQADELTRRLNAEAAAKGMFTSGTRVDALGRELGSLDRQRMVELAKGSADIRGQRPELLLQERQQRAEIANMWGQMDINAQGQNLDAFLNGRLMEYDRMFKNGQLSLDSFNGNTNMMGLFLDYMVSSAQTDAERSLVAAKIDEIYWSMPHAERQQFIDFMTNMAGAAGSAIGVG